MQLDVLRPSELEERDLAIIVREYGGPLDDCDFVVYFRKHVDYAEYHGDWDGEPIASGRRVVKIDEPDNWKTTWFLFFHA